MTIASSTAAPVVAAKLTALQAEVRRVLAAYAEQPGDAGIWQELLTMRRAAAEAIVALPTAQKGGPAVDLACAILHDFEQSGAADQPVTPEDAALVESYRTRNWPGLLASMLLVPAWQWPTAPALDDVQPWLWAEYTRWLFYTPKGFTAIGQAEDYAAHSLRRLEELATWGTRNRGSAAVKQALDAFLQGGDATVLQLGTGSLRRHAELRGKVLKAAFGVASQDALEPTARFGRRLRIGFVASEFGADVPTYGTLPLFEQLDPERFEALLFAFQTTESPIEDYCRAHAGEFHLLPNELAAQLDVIRAAAPDVLVFSADIATAISDVTRLALHRLAPLQVVSSLSRTTSGLPEIDLYVSGDLLDSAASADHYSERLGLVKGPAHAFNVTIDQPEPTIEWTRAALGLPSDAVVFVSAADYRRITPEVQDRWARILTAVPGARLLVHPFHHASISSPIVKRFCADFDHALSTHGVASDRFCVLTDPFISRSDVKAFLRVADVYLDAYPVSSAAGLIDAFEVGLPTVVHEGDAGRARRGGALLRTLGLLEVVASSPEQYGAIAARLAADREYRETIARRMREGMERGPLFLDTLAASDSFGDLIEKSFDELTDVGRAAFRSNQAPLLVAGHSPEAEASFAFSSLEIAQRALRASPGDTVARHNFGRALLDVGRSARAVPYLLAALQGGENNATLWRDLALALRADGKRNQSIEALETCLRLDPSNGESWLLLIDLAESSGAADFAREALEAFRANVPDHEQIPMIAARLGC